MLREYMYTILMSEEPLAYQALLSELEGVEEYGRVMLQATPPNNIEV